MVVVEHEHRLVVGIPRSGDPLVPRTEVAIRDVRRRRLPALAHSLSEPRAIVAVRRDDHPLTAKGMPALFPDHGLLLAGGRSQCRPLGRVNVGRWAALMSAAGPR